MPYYPYPGWPYAAKAVIQSEFDDVDEYTSWLTFPLAMDQTVTPSKTLFIVRIGSTDHTPYFVTWVDAYTLKLVTASEDGSRHVQIEYNGPSQNLRTMYKKQWEPWGYILSLDITT